MATHGSPDLLVDFDHQNMSSPQRRNRVTSPVGKSVSHTAGVDVNNMRNDMALCRSNVGAEQVQAAADLPIPQYVDMLMYNLSDRACKLPERMGNHICDTAVRTEEIDEPVSRETVV